MFALSLCATASAASLLGTALVGVDFKSSAGKAVAEGDDTASSSASSDRLEAATSLCELQVAVFGAAAAAFVGG